MLQSWKWEGCAISSNSICWNSTYRQLCCIAELDQSKVDTLLHDNCHDNLILSTKDLQQLQEIVNILEPFAEATDMIREIRWSPSVAWSQSCCR